jgi:transposase
MTDIATMTADLSDERLQEIAAESHSTRLPLPKLRELIALGRLANQVEAERGISYVDALHAAQEELGIRPVPPPAIHS